MSNFLEIRPLIRDFVAELLPDTFNACYWISERLEVPKKPYCLLTELNETTDLRTSERQNKDISNQKDVTMYKTSVITIAVYVDGLDNFDIQKELAYSTINNIRTQFEIMCTKLKFKKYFSINSITGIRPLNELVDGGYLFRYEFDLSVGFNEVYSYDLEIGKNVIIDLEANNIHIEVKE